MIDKVFIFESALRELREEQARWGIRETGGLLLGYIAQGTGVITQITGPGAKARHGFCRFERDAEYSKAKVAEEFSISKGLITYIGEWHTHPLGLLRPSRIDNDQMKEISLDAERQCSEPLLLLSGSLLVGKDCLNAFVYRGSAIPLPVEVLVSHGY